MESTRRRMALARSSRGPRQRWCNPWHGATWTTKTKSFKPGLFTCKYSPWYFAEIFDICHDTVDGRNPAPVDMVNIPLFTWFSHHSRWLFGISEAATVWFFQTLTIVNTYGWTLLSPIPTPSRSSWKASQASDCWLSRFAASYETKTLFIGGADQTKSRGQLLNF